MGAPTALAYQAGHSVQSHVSFMITKLNILQYLRDRSNLWKTMSEVPASIDPPLNILSQEKINKSLQVEIYDIEPVLDLLASAGFTGKDIAVILSHTPKIAMMKAKSTGDESITSLQDTIQHTYFGLLCDVFKLRKCDARKVGY